MDSPQEARLAVPLVQSSRRMHHSKEGKVYKNMDPWNCVENKFDKKAQLQSQQSLRKWFAKRNFVGHTKPGAGNCCMFEHCFFSYIDPSDYNIPQSESE